MEKTVEINSNYTAVGNCVSGEEDCTSAEKRRVTAAENQFGKISRVSLCAAVRDGRTYLEDVSFTAPYKIMMPFEKSNGGIQVMPLCASAGIMRGDRQEFFYRVREGANLEVLSQSFEKIHRMETAPSIPDPAASRHICAEVDKNATLYCCPQPVLPFAGSAFDSTAEIRLTDESSVLYWLEIISGGRTAHGERFAYRRFSSRVCIYRAGTLIYRDNTRYEPQNMPMEGIGMYEGYTHMANIFLSAPSVKASQNCQKEYVGAARDSFPGKKTVKNGIAVGQRTTELKEKIWELLEQEEACEGGVTSLWQGDLVVRIFGSRAQTLQRAAEKIRLLYDGFCGLSG